MREPTQKRPAAATKSSQHGGDSTYLHPFRQMLTVYGRKAVLEALRDDGLEAENLHLADSNRRGGIVAEILSAARERGVSVQFHNRESLARISKNGKQDQGVALDVRCPRMRELDKYLADETGESQRFLAFDGLTNPQNLGMALRSAVAAGVDGILYADRGNPALGPLVIKASTGTVFRAPLLRCSDIATGARRCLDTGFTLYRLQAGGDRSLFEGSFARRALFVLGGESEGLSPALQSLPGEDLAIPMQGDVESLNVAVTAALVGYFSAGNHTAGNCNTEG